MQLGYIGFEVSDLSAWRLLCTDVIGLMPAPDQGEVHRYRMDGKEQRLFLQSGAADDVCALGLTTEDAAEYEKILQGLQKNGVAFEEGSEAAAAARGVACYVRIKAPDGIPIELAPPVRTAPNDYTSSYAGDGWLTGSLGVGHVVLFVSDKDGTTRFLAENFGFRPSNIGKFDLEGGMRVEVDFLYCNGRHHSLAVASIGTQPPKLTAHFMLERRSVTDVVHTFDRVIELGVPVTHQLGRHTDGAFSFYARTPSGFEFEVGAESVIVDDDWVVTPIYEPALWGHNGPVKADA